MNKKQIILLVSLFLVVSGVALFFSSQRQSALPVPTAAVAKPILWKGIEPGTTTEEQVVKTMGPPASTKEESLGKTLSYPSNNQYWVNDVNTLNGVVRFVREQVFPPAEISLTKRTASLKTDPTILYGPGASSGQLLYVYPGGGVAFLANKYLDTVYEAWHFSTTTLNGFLQLPEAQGYGTTESMSGP